MTATPTKPTTLDLLHIADAFLANSWEWTEEEFAARLDSFLEESADKLGALRAIHLRLAEQAATYKAEAERFTTARKGAERQDERIKSLAYMLLCARRELGEEPVVKGVARIQGNGGKAPLLGVDTLDEAAVKALPDELVIVTRVPNRDAIRAHLEAGGTVPGVTLGERGEGLRWA